jgi:hypothetical protein
VVVEGDFTLADQLIGSAEKAAGEALARSQASHGPCRHFPAARSFTFAIPKISRAGCRKVA